ncbi:hypothetical protein T03_5880 [Trichinella britovi]|uniref:Uncharacterized protein n=1 Tax=Trichinella britovi TaxID=45882 RepID=A0A0V0Z0I3_TRIBR|nr:hypothetical protein T03_5880 [Trichinella britovi]
MDALRESFGSIIQLKCLKMFLPEEVDGVVDFRV